MFPVNIVLVSTTEFDEFWTIEIKCKIRDLRKNYPKNIKAICYEIGNVMNRCLGITVRILVETTSKAANFLDKQIQKLPICKDFHEKV